MNVQTSASAVRNERSPANPHILWRQVLGLVLWVGVLSVPFSGFVVTLFKLALGGVTFADAWKSGIYKRPDNKSFLNISPMSWGIAMALLFIIAWPVYLLNRNKLRTIHGTNVYFWATVVLGGILMAMTVLSIMGQGLWKE